MKTRNPALAGPLNLTQASNAVAMGLIGLTLGGAGLAIANSEEQLGIKLLGYGVAGIGLFAAANEFIEVFKGPPVVFDSVHGPAVAFEDEEL